MSLAMLPSELLLRIVEEIPRGPRTSWVHSPHWYEMDTQDAYPTLTILRLVNRALHRPATRILFSYLRFATPACRCACSFLHWSANAFGSSATTLHITLSNLVRDVAVSDTYRLLQVLPNITTLIVGSTRDSSPVGVASFGAVFEAVGIANPPIQRLSLNFHPSFHDPPLRGLLLALRPTLRHLRLQGCFFDEKTALLIQDAANLQSIAACHCVIMPTDGMSDPSPHEPIVQLGQVDCIPPQQARLEILELVGCWTRPPARDVWEDFVVKHRASLKTLGWGQPCRDTSLVDGLSLPNLRHLHLNLNRSFYDVTSWRSFDAPEMRTLVVSFTDPSIEQLLRLLQSAGSRLRQVYIYEDPEIDSRGRILTPKWTLEDLEIVLRSAGVAVSKLSEFRTEPWQASAHPAQC